MANRKTKEGVEEAIPKLMAKMGDTSQRLTLSLKEARDYQEAMKLLGNLDLLDAVRHYVDHKKRGSLRRVTFAAAAIEFKAAKQTAKVSRAYTASIEFHLNFWEKKFGERIIEDLKSSELAKYLHRQEVSDRSKNNCRGVLVIFLNWCKNKGGMLPKNEPTAADEIEVIKTVETRLSVLSPEELDTFLLATKGNANVYRFCAMSALTGIRAAELDRLTWADVQLQADLIEVPAAKAKTAARRLVPVNPRLKTILEAVKEKTGPILNVQLVTIYKSLRRICAKAKLKWPSNAGRHSWISYRVAATGDVARVALEAGNSPAKIFSNYRSVKLPDGRLITQDLAREWFGEKSLAKEGELRGSAGIPDDSEVSGNSP
ncbi:MAG: tyrosine-type recombinase/integrase [Candidatus Methylacidiphilales bacterium]|nr:hypothetical protein [Candidatus Methylacidiphilales bacterium]